ncbi:DUF2510 domain-containing protein [Gordonia sp. (in: high G+C Gram-positive bacteria)]|uniref:DUF2510 domain-containing protein n=1 Tax=Gordonia sp. (in: high G+C Gram-positive bacteria) TaxID=84139 RepID=UPI0039E571FA
MGTRKFMSVSTAGLVDFRSDKERTAAYAKATKKQAKAQTKLMEQQLRLQQAQAVPPPPQQLPAGWYPDQQQPGMVRWFDGHQWTAHVQPQQQ